MMLNAHFTEIEPQTIENKDDISLEHLEQCRGRIRTLYLSDKGLLDLHVDKGAERLGFLQLTDGTPATRVPRDLVAFKRQSTK